jgi:hypothetical protein
MGGLGHPACKALFVIPRGEDAPGGTLVQLSHHSERIRVSKVDRDGWAIAESESFLGRHKRGVTVFPAQALGAAGGLDSVPLFLSFIQSDTHSICEMMVLR